MVALGESYTNGVGVYSLFAHYFNQVLGGVPGYENCLHWQVNSVFSLLQDIPAADPTHSLRSESVRGWVRVSPCPKAQLSYWKTEGGRAGGREERREEQGWDQDMQISSFLETPLQSGFFSETLGWGTGGGEREVQVWGDKAEDSLCWVSWENKIMRGGDCVIFQYFHMVVSLMPIKLFLLQL